MLKREVIDLWDQTLKILEKNVNKYSYETWFKSLKPFCYHQNTVVIEVPNNFSRGWLSDRYSPLLKGIFRDILKKEIDVQFLLSSEIPGAQKNYFEKIDDINQTRLNPKYTFDSFVVGNSNRFTHAACLAVADTPAKSYNPLFIYGGVGLGKTHLMHAISQHILGCNKNMKVSYLTSEKFTNELIKSIREDNTVEFRNKYRSADILLIDDIQFLAGKERTQEEFFHTFNTLYESHKQIIISSDRPPKEIPTLEDRLRSRFEWGLITDIQPPDLETRIAILQKKAELEELEIQDETIFFIADNIQSNIRILEGALIRLAAHASLNGIEINPENAAKILKDILPDKKPRPVTTGLIQEIVGEYFNIRIEEFASKKRARIASYPRQIAMYLTRELTPLSLPQIGDAFGGRDHTTVIYACDKITAEMQQDINLQEIIKNLINKIENS